MPRSISRASGNLYDGVGLHPAPLGEHSRGTAAGVCGIPGFWVDLDVAGPGHKATNLPPAMPPGVSSLARCPLPPSYVISSGGGLHLLLAVQGVLVTSPTRTNAVTRRGSLARLQWLVIAAGAQARLDGRQHQRPRPGAAAGRHDQPQAGAAGSSGARAAGRAAVATASRSWRPSCPSMILPFPAAIDRAHVPRSGPARAPAALWSRITAQCAYMAHCEDDAATLSEPEWHAMMTVLGRCHNGEAIAHRVSAPYPGYDASETAKKFAYALSADAPMRCDTIRAYRGGEPWCSGCPFWGASPHPSSSAMCRATSTPPAMAHRRTTAQETRHDDRQQRRSSMTPPSATIDAVVALASADPKGLRGRVAGRPALVAAVVRHAAADDLWLERLIGALRTQRMSRWRTASACASLIKDAHPGREASGVASATGTFRTIGPDAAAPAGARRARGMTRRFTKKPSSRRDFA